MYLLYPTDHNHSNIAEIWVISVLPLRIVFFLRLIQFLLAMWNIDTSVVPPLIYAVMGSSKEIAIGPVAVVSLLLSSMIQKIVDPVADPISYRKLVFTATFFTGLFQVAFGLFRQVLWVESEALCEFNLSKDSLVWFCDLQVGFPSGLSLSCYPRGFHGGSRYHHWNAAAKGSARPFPLHEQNRRGFSLECRVFRHPWAREPPEYHHNNL